MPEKPAQTSSTVPQQAQDAAEVQVLSEDADVLPPAVPAAPAAAAPTGKRKSARQMAEDLMAEESLERRIERAEQAGMAAEKVHDRAETAEEAAGKRIEEGSKQLDRIRIGAAKHMASKGPPQAEAWVLLPLAGPGATG